MTLKARVLVRGRQPRQVQAKMFMRGLWLSDCMTGDGLLTITHALSGCAILENVRPADLRAISRALQAVRWDVPAEAIFDSVEHREAVEMARNLRKVMSNRQEKKTAKDVGGRQQPASGSRPGAKRDVQSHRVLIECKTTIPGGRDHVPVQVKDLETLRKQGVMSDKVPCFQVSVFGAGGLVLIPADDTVDMEGYATVEVDVRRKRTFTITAETIEQLNRSTVLLVNTAKRAWYGFSYHEFLEVLRQDTEAIPDDDAEDEDD